MCEEVLRDIPADEWNALFDLPIGDASLLLGVHRTKVSKHIAHKFGIDRWPYKHRMSMRRLLDAATLDHDAPLILDIIDAWTDRRVMSERLRAFRRMVYLSKEKKCAPRENGTAAEQSVVGVPQRAVQSRA